MQQIENRVKCDEQDDIRYLRSRTWSNTISTLNNVLLMISCDLSSVRKL